MDDAVSVADAERPMPPALEALGQVTCDVSFEEMAQQLLDFHRTVGRLSETSMEGRRHSRTALASLHRGDLSAARATLEKVRRLPTLEELTGKEVEPDALLSCLFAGSHSSFVQENLRTLAFLSFLDTGVLTITFPDGLSSGVLDYDDEQYLLGLIGAAKELERYAVNRGKLLDLRSVEVCLSTVQSFEQALMQFDFRNSVLRRSFDTIKYTVKKLEEVCYEIGMALKRKEAWGNANDGDDNVAQAKVKFDPPERATVDGKTVKAVDLQLLTDILHRYRLFDERRENCIKRSRDVQKNAKNAIHALQRGSLKKSNDLLQQCAKHANAIHQELLLQTPLLRRGGSFADSLEEFVEALALSEFIQNKRIIGIKDAEHRGGLQFPVTLIEYLGGMLDLTGEVGRLAVRGAGKVADDELLQHLACVDTIYSGIQGVDYLPGAIGKKLDGLRRTCRTIENVLYELSLLKSGKSKVRPPAEKEEDGQAEAD